MDLEMSTVHLRRGHFGNNAAFLISQCGSYWSAVTAQQNTRVGWNVIEWELWELFKQSHTARLRSFTVITSIRDTHVIPYCTQHDLSLHFRICSRSTLNRNSILGITNEHSIMTKGITDKERRWLGANFLSDHLNNYLLCRGEVQAVKTRNPSICIFGLPM